MCVGAGWQIGAPSLYTYTVREEGWNRGQSNRLTILGLGENVNQEDISLIGLEAKRYSTAVMRLLKSSWDAERDKVGDAGMTKGMQKEGEGRWKNT